MRVLEDEDGPIINRTLFSEGKETRTIISR